MQSLRLRRIGLVLLGTAVTTTWLAAAQFRVDVGLVNVVATVLDDRGRHVADLLPEDFELYEDGQPQEISHFAFSSDLPVSVGIILDVSGSMESKISTASSAVERFIRRIHPDDDIFLMTFDDRPRLVEDFTDDRGELASALRRIRVEGGTALYDAVALGVEHVQEGRHEKKAILVITDGEDTSSSRTFEQAQRVVRESEVLVYALGIAPEPGGTLGGPAPGRSPTPPTFPTPFPSPFPFPGGPTGTSPTGRVAADTVDMDALEVFASISGGRTWLVSGGSDNGRRSQIADALDEVANELRNQYSIGYYPVHPLDDGEWHLIGVSTKNPRYGVRVREDYYGGDR